MKFLYITALLFTFLGCAHCSSTNSDTPNIRTMPGEEDCGAMCDKFKELNCVGYYEDIPQGDGGVITCQSFCIYELHNSIPLNPTCLVQNLTSCDQIENICK